MNSASRSKWRSRLLFALALIGLFSISNQAVGVQTYTYSSPGTISSSDCSNPARGEGYYTDVFVVSSNATISLSMAKGSLGDPYLQVVNSDRTTVYRADDDSGGNLDAWISSVSVNTGQYILATTYARGATGTYTLYSSVPLTQVTSCPQVITWNPPSTGTYGSTATFTATTNMGLQVSVSSSNTSVCSVSNSGSTFTINYLSAGSCTLTGSQAGSGSVGAAPSVTRNITVGAKSLSLTGLSANKTYDGNTVAAIQGSAGISGLVNGDSVSVTGTPSGTFNSPAAGTRTVNVAGLSLSGTKASNYTLVSSFTATIAKRDLTIEIVGLPTKTYDGLSTITLGSSNYSISNVVSGETIGISNTTGSLDSDAAGSRTVSVTSPVLTGATAANYQILGSVTGSAVVSKRSISITGSFTPSSKQYDGTTNVTVSSVALVANPASLVSGDSLTLDPSFAFVDSGVSSSAQVVISACVLGGPDAANYLLTLTGAPSATTQISPRDLILTGLNANKTYDGNANAQISGTATISGVIGTEDVQVSGVPSGSFDSSNAGSRTVTLTGLSLVGANASNYQLPNSLAATIAKRDLTIEIVGLPTKTYDGLSTITLGSSNYSISNVVSGETIGISNTTGSLDSDAAGSRTVSVTSPVLTGATAANYQILGSVTGSAVVSKRSISITGSFTPSSKQYDGTTNVTVSSVALVANPASLVSGDSLTLDPSFAFVDSGVSSSAQVVISACVLGGPDAANYLLTLTGAPSATTQISPRDLILTGLNANKTYDGNANAQISGTATISGVIGTEDVQVSGVPSGSFDSSNAGSRTVTLTGLSLVGANASNYQLPNSLAATIAKRDLTIEIVGLPTKTYDGLSTITLGSSNYSISNVVSGETIGISNTTGSLDSDAAGSRTVSVTSPVLTGATAANYQILGSVTGSAVVSKRSISITGSFTPSSKQYDGTTNVTVSSVALVANPASLVSGDSLTLDPSFAFVDSDVSSSAQVVISACVLGGPDAANYLLTLTGAPSATTQISPRDLILTGLNANKTYDGNANAQISGTATISGVIGTEDVQVSGVPSGSFDSSNAGSRTVTLTGLSLVGANASNYQLPNSLAATIAKRDLTIEIVGLPTKTYDGLSTITLGSSNYSISNVVSGETIGISNTTGSLDSDAAGSRTVSVTSPVLTGATAANYQILGSVTGSAVVSKRSISITGSFTPSSKQYDGTTNVTVSSVALVANPASLVSGDSLTLDPSFAFVDSGVSSSAQVVISACVLGGPDAANYLLTLTGAPSATTQISPRDLILTGLNANKTYDGNANAQISGTATISGVIGTEDVQVSGVPSGSFDSSNAGSRTVTLTGLSLVGANASNYQLPNSLAATIAKRDLTIEIVGLPTKTYDGLSTITLGSSNYSISNVVSGETIGISNTTGSLDSDAAGSRTVSVTSPVLTGATAANYQILGSVTGSIEIAKRIVRFGGSFSVSDKVFDGNSLAQIVSSSIAIDLSDIVSGDSFSFSPAAEFVSSAPGTSVQVAISQILLLGPNSANYQVDFSTVATSSAAIFPKEENQDSYRYFGPILDAYGLTVTPEQGSSDSLKVFGSKLNEVLSVSVNGQAATISGQAPSQMNLQLPSLEPGTYDLVIKHKSGTLTQIGAIVVTPPVTKRILGDGWVVTVSSYRGRLVVFQKNLKGMAADIVVDGHIHRLQPFKRNYQAVRVTAVDSNEVVNFRILINDLPIGQSTIFTRP